MKTNNIFAEIMPENNNIDGTIHDNQVTSASEGEVEDQEQSQTAAPVTENLELHPDKLTGPAPEQHIKIINEEKVVMDNREFHEVANIFSVMAKEEFIDLKNDISKNGLHEEIWTDKDGAIIDGKNRYLACMELGVTPKYRTYDGDGSLLDFVISLNLKRRHLTDGQKAFITIKIEALFAEEAKERQREAGRLYGQNHPKNKPVTKHLGSFDAQEQELSQIIEQPLKKTNTNENKAAQQAAVLVGTNRQSVAAAKKIAKTAPDVAEVVISGKLGIPDAVKISKLAEPMRMEILSQVVDGSKPSDAIGKSIRATLRAELESIEAMIMKEIVGVYDVLVIDPPWPMPADLPYPKMTLDEIRDLKLPCADDCHIFLWTTHKFLPDAFETIKAWGLEYVCTFVWHKNGALQPLGLPQYNCEFALYCRNGSPKFVDIKDFWTCFYTPRGGHSEKPEEFYAVLRRVTAGRRLDMFNRRAIDGFDTWGLEAA